MVPLSPPKQTSSHQTSVLELPIIFCTLVSRFQVLLPSFKRLPLCYSLLALFLVVYRLCSLPLLVLHPRLFCSFSFKEDDSNTMAALRAAPLLQPLTIWGILNKSLQSGWRPWLTAGGKLSCALLGQL